MPSVNKILQVGFIPTITDITYKMEKSKPLGGRTRKGEAALTRDLYFGDHYFSDNQMTSMTKQIQYVHARRPKRVLEIGLGNGFVSSFLSSAGYDVTTMDINENLKPDVVGDITELDSYFENGAFDLVLCAEVLEHMPLADSLKALEKMSIVSSKHVIVTLPRSQKILFDFQFYMKLPTFARFASGLFMSLPWRRENILNHHWELDSKKKTTIKEMKKLMEENYKVASLEREKLNPYHYFFALEIK